MRLLAVSPLLGLLTLQDIYEYYDEPVLFTCINTLDQLFLVLSIGKDDKAREWLYLPISEKRYKDLKSGYIDLYIAFSNPEEGYLYKVTIPNTYALHKVEQINQGDILEEWLPNEEEYLIMPSECLYD